MNDLEAFIHGLYAEKESQKLAEQDFSGFTIPELEAILGIDQDEGEEKLAYGLAKAAMCGHVNEDQSYLEAFEGTPLFSQAAALCEEMIGLEEKDLAQRAQRDAERAQLRLMDGDDNIWRAKDGVRLKKRKLMLQLRKAQAAGAVPSHEDIEEAEAAPPAMMGGMGKSSGLLLSLVQGGVTFRMKAAAADAAVVQGSGNVEYIGDVNTGSSDAPAWPRAAMGVDAAGRQATPSETKKQRSVYPQTTEPKTAASILGVARASRRGLGTASTKALREASSKVVPKATKGVSTKTLRGAVRGGRSIFGDAADIAHLRKTHIPAPPSWIGK